MQKTVASTSSESAAAAAASATAMPVLLALSAAHLLNDMMQSLVPAIYPIIKDLHGLSFSQIGLITLVFQLTASLFQPAVGFITDKKPQPYSLATGMIFTLIGLVVLGTAASFETLLIGAALVGTGSAIFHPEATRVARMASGGKQGFAQAVFQLGGQGGGALGPVLAAFIVVPNGQASLASFAVTALLAMLVLSYVGRWYSQQLVHLSRPKKGGPAGATSPYSTSYIWFAVFILIVLMFSKSAYTASFTSYYTFFVIDRFNVSIETAQLMLFAYLASGALGVLVGGPLGDKIGRRRIIWFSILGALPFSLILPHTDFYGTLALTILVAFIMASAFAAILVFAMELLPGRIGLIGGLFYGLVFGLGGVSAALLGEVADLTSIATVFKICAFLPAIGLLTWFLPDIRS
ncbi:MAG: MFS transporter [Hyphomicrobiaceae bacterium TMED74]|nr:MFS transporter [Filomicrobium sp.]RPG46452.1 MAG: MFS transporter [Hyphomicrobiaceae bacterium TMED74]